MMTLYIDWKDDAQNAHRDSLRIRVKEVSLKAIFAGFDSEDDSLATKVVKAALGVTARMDAFECYMVRITGYRLRLERFNNWIFDGTSSEAKLTEAMHEALRTCSAGDMLYIQQITAQLSDGSERALDDLRFVLY